jgi:hypothetical protein
VYESASNVTSSPGAAENAAWSSGGGSTVELSDEPCKFSLTCRLWCRREL